MFKLSRTKASSPQSPDDGARSTTPGSQPLKPPSRPTPGLAGPTPPPLGSRLPPPSSGAARQTVATLPASQPMKTPLQPTSRLSKVARRATAGRAVSRPSGPLAVGRTGLVHRERPSQAQSTGPISGLEPGDPHAPARRRVWRTIPWRNVAWTAAGVLVALLLMLAYDRLLPGQPRLSRARGQADRRGRPGLGHTAAPGCRACVRCDRTIGGLDPHQGGAGRRAGRGERHRRRARSAGRDPDKPARGSERHRDRDHLR